MLKTPACQFGLTLLCLTSGISGAQAQTYTPSDRIPVADGMLGTQVTGSNNNFNITGGLVKGQTLFHSFSDFSVPTNGRVDFTNPAGNRDIITRVTGSLFSDINGTVNTNGANFFLINPNGIVFGTGAQLNVGKAFVGSTANSLDLVAGDGSTINFGTNPSGDAPLLSVAPNVLFDVSRLHLGGGNGSISNFGTLATNSPDLYIGLIGGNINMNGGQIIAPGGRVELSALSAPGPAIVSADGINFRSQLPANTARGDISLTNLANIDITSVAGGGEISIDARNIDLLDTSFLTSGIPNKLGLLNSRAGDIKLNATAKIAVSNNSIISNRVNAGANIIGIGSAGNIQIDTGSLSIENKSNISSNNAGTIGNAGKISIIAKDKISLDFSYISSGVGATVSKEVNNGADISISAAALSLNNLASIFSTSTYAVNPGNIEIDIGGAIEIDNSRIYSSISLNRGIGKAGDLNINATDLFLRNNSEISSTSLFGSSAGTVSINADRFVNISESSVFIRSNSLPSNDPIEKLPGSILISAPEITLDRAKVTADAVFFSRVSSIDDGGNIYIGSNKSSTAAQTKLLLLRNGSLISTNADDTNLSTMPNGGNIKIDSALIVAIPVENSDVTANATRGSGGKVNITAQGIYGIEFQPKLTPNSDITASSAFGQTGAVKVNTPGIDPGKNNTQLPAVPTDASDRISRVCGESNRQNKLTIAGRGGLPPTAYDLLTDDVIWQDDRSSNTTTKINNSATLPPPAIGLVLDRNGNATLVAARTDKQSIANSVTCSQTKQK